MSCSALSRVRATISSHRARTCERVSSTSCSTRAHLVGLLFGEVEDLRHARTHARGQRVERGSSVATGVEDYYVGGAEPPGRWEGELAKEVGLEGVLRRWR